MSRPSPTTAAGPERRGAPGCPPPAGPGRGAVSPEAMREAMRLLASPVAVLAAGLAGEPRGLTVGSLFSLSLEPPMVGFAVRRESTSWPAILAAGRFRISVLADGQAAVAAALSRSQSTKFDAVPWSWSAHGNPAVAGALLGIECLLHREVETGDHLLVTAHVRTLEPGRSSNSGEASDKPLVYYLREYRTLEAHA